MNNLHTVSSVLHTLFDKQLWLQDSKPVRELIFNMYILLVHFHIINLCTLSTSAMFTVLSRTGVPLRMFFSMWVTALSGRAGRYDQDLIS